MTDLKSQIELLSRSTKLDNKQIADKLACSERSVRRYAGEWKERVKVKLTPQEMSGGERKAFLMYDAHIPYHDERAYNVAVDYARTWDPDEIGIVGDYVDFKDVSHWKDDPRRMPFTNEVALIKAHIRALRETFPDKRIFYIEGNHESRLARFLWTKAPELCGLPELTIPRLLDLEPLGVEYISNVDRMNHNIPPFRLGKLYLLHGHEINLGSGTVNLARTMYLKTHVNVIFGHHHQSQHYIFKKLNSEHEGSWSVGCLCKLSENYAPMNNWVHGFCTLKYNPITGFFKIRNKMIIGGQVF